MKTTISPELERPQIEYREKTPLPPSSGWRRARRQHCPIAPKNDRDECHEHKNLSDHRIGRIKRHQQRSCGAGKRQSDAAAQRKIRDWDRCPSASRPRVSAQPRASPCRGRWRARKPREARSAPSRARRRSASPPECRVAEMQRLVRIPGVDGAIVRCQQHQRQIEDQQRQRKCQKDLR